jgi:Ca2+:H+ antiporter
MSWLLLFIPVAIGLEHWLPEQHIAIFAASGLAILPLAGWMGRATEHLAERLGEGVGGLLNATFGNAAELIIALVALQAGLYDVVKASIAGSIIGNILLVQGAAMLAGGLRYKEQKFNTEGARAEAVMLTLAAIALILPAAYRVAMGAGAAAGLVPLSLAISVVLLGVYGLFLLYSLRTHAGLFRGSHAAAAGDDEGGHEPWSVARAGGVLLAATVGIAWMSELLVGSIQPAAASLGLGSAFVGVFVVAILGNAAEHATAITVALKNRMDLALSIRHRLEHPGGAVRGARPGAGQPRGRAPADGSRAAGRAGAERAAGGADQRPDGGRRAVGLAEGRAVAGGLWGAGAHVLLHLGGGAVEPRPDARVAGIERGVGLDDVVVSRPDAARSERPSADTTPAVRESRSRADCGSPPRTGRAATPARSCE